MKKVLFTLLGLLFTYAAMGQTPQAASNNQSNTTSTYQDAPATPHEVAIQNANPQSPSEPLSLWYTTPATNWVREALPIGNGDMGAMILGGVAQDRIQFNHKTLWKGTSQPTDLGSYLPFGDIYITNLNAKNTTNYRRSLNLRTAVADVQYDADGECYTREYLCSNADKVVAIRYKAKHARNLSLSINLINAQGLRATYTTKGATFSGTLTNGMAYAATMRVCHKAGRVTATSDGIEINRAKEVVIFLACTTNFAPTQANHLAGNVSQIMANISSTVQAASNKGFERVMSRHINDHAQLFNRVNFTLQGAEHTQPTNLLLTANTNGANNMIDQLIFQYGRYLTIAASRGIDVPSNLQGLWNKDGYRGGDAVWASDIHSNINVQMNYWPSEPTNLSECHMPFLNFICNEALRHGGQWQQNARQLGVETGWVVNTAGNIFGGSSNYKIGKYSVVNAWYCSHLWQHFAYTCDTTFLRQKAMPVMKAACDFWVNRLVEAQNGDGTLECPNEYSPEQGYVQNATAHSQQLVTQLFEQTLKAIEVLGHEASGCDNAYVDLLKSKLNKLDKGLRIDQNGLLREWKYQDNTPNLSANTDFFADDEHNVWQGHRHTSHLMALYPGFNIDPGKDSRIFAAAIKSLANRGDDATGWARAWRISLWARARNNAHAYQTLRGFAHHTTNTNYDWQGGLYDNLLDAHATSVFQIEGNYGATAGIAEMLLQSRPDSLVLLPALPPAWANGQIDGLKAIGNFEIGMAWCAGKLSTLRILSIKGTPVTLAYPHLAQATIVNETTGEKVTPNSHEGNRLSFNTMAGHTYRITLPHSATGVQTALTNK